MSKINVTLPDGSIRTYPQGITAFDVAKSISEGLARNVLAAEVNGQVWDSTRPLPENTALKLLTWNDDNGKMAFWHSSAHLLAEALEALYENVKFAIGPPIENGFYYDVDFGEKTFSSDDLPKIEKKMKELAKQKANLDSQKTAKASLLAATKNDEAKYQSLLSQARAQLSAFRSFVTRQGGASILSNQTKCNDWGCYYNQRDSQWGDIFLGGTTYLMKESGCFITSVAMLASHVKRDIKPGDIAQLPVAVTSGGDLKWSFSVNGIGVSITSASKTELDQRLSGGPVIAGLYGGPDHFIVILRKEGDSYIMHDPFLENGSNKKLTDKYSVSDITSLRLVQFN